MTKKLSESLKNKYLRKAEEKIFNDTKETLEIIKARGLSPAFENLATVDEAEHRYNVAKAMWEKDGYEEQPTNFASMSERETRFAQSIFWS